MQATGRRPRPSSAVRLQGPPEQAAPRVPGAQASRPSSRRNTRAQGDLYDSSAGPLARPVAIGGGRTTRRRYVIREQILTCCAIAGCAIARTRLAPASCDAGRHENQKTPHEERHNEDKHGRGGIRSLVDSPSLRRSKLIDLDAKLIRHLLPYLDFLDVLDDRCSSGVRKTNGFLGGRCLRTDRHHGDPRLGGGVQAVRIAFDAHLVRALARALASIVCLASRGSRCRLGTLRNDERRRDARPLGKLVLHWVASDDPRIEARSDHQRVNRR